MGRNAPDRKAVSFRLMPCLWVKIRKNRTCGHKNGVPGGTRTPSLLVRSQTLNPIELRERILP